MICRKHKYSSVCFSYEQIDEIELPFDRVKNQRRAYVFISYESEEVVEKVIAESKQMLGGKEVWRSSFCSEMISLAVRCAFQLHIVFADMTCVFCLIPFSDLDVKYLSTSFLSISVSENFEEMHRSRDFRVLVKISKRRLAAPRPVDPLTR